MLHKIQTAIPPLLHKQSSHSYPRKKVHKPPPAHISLIERPNFWEFTLIVICALQFPLDNIKTPRYPDLPTGVLRATCRLPNMLVRLCIQLPFAGTTPNASRNRGQSTLSRHTDNHSDCKFIQHTLWSGAGYLQPRARGSASSPCAAQSAIA